MKKIRELYKNNFFRDSVILSGGTAVAQILPFLFYPILGRIFSVEEFGLLAALTAVTSILAVVASGKYESAILVADGKKEAASLALLSIVLSAVFLLLIYLVLQFALGNTLCMWLKEPMLKNMLWICPISAWAIIIFTVYNEWCVREKHFKSLSVNKIVNSGAIVGAKTVFGFVRVFTHGLVIGDVIGRIISALVCVVRALVRDGKTFYAVKKNEMVDAAKKYIDFPKFTMPGQLLNTIALQFPILLLAVYFNKTEVGYFSMAMTIFAIPLTVISGAVRDVFRQRANEQLNTSGSCRQLFIKVTVILSLMAVGAAAAMVWFLPQLTTLFLGPQWHTCGVYAQILCGAMVLSFVANSLSGMFIVANKLRQLFYWQLYFVTTTIAAILVGGLVYKSMIVTIALFSILRASAYLLSIIMTYRYTVVNVEK
ncbi:MAG: oligosaccharide flippase family protein [Bacteroidales bacterium]|nr:oligosaccharide flippase family protein [Bacteroidales bacterium]